MSAPFALPMLKRLFDAEPEGASGSACRRCGTGLPEDHLHIADLETRALECVCVHCHAAAPQAPDDSSATRRIPRRYIRLPDETVSDVTWDALGIPVGIAFIFHNTALGRIVVCYPGAAGATESLLPIADWPDLVTTGPDFPAPASDVEALLVRRTTHARDCFVAPIDACYELAGRIRRRWTGFGGGPEVHAEMAAFFAMLTARSEEVTA